MAGFRSFRFIVLLVTVIGLGVRVAKTTADPAGSTFNPHGKDQDLAQVVSGNNWFALDLYRYLTRGSTENLVFSPYSIYSALAMVYAGARGETAQQMGQALHFALPDTRLHAAFKALRLALVQAEEASQEPGERLSKLRVANALWGQEGRPFLPAFVDALAQNYGAGLYRVDFAGNPERARLTINAWVAEKTEGRVPELLGPEDIQDITLLVLTNAIHFFASWHYAFNERWTYPEPFYPLEGSQILVPMMHQTELFGYCEGSDYQAVELPYRGRDESPGPFSMVILLPRPGRFLDFERSLTRERLERILGQLAPKDVALSLPKFRFKAKFRLREALEALGMPLAFSTQADFSGMDGTYDLCIDNVIHEAFVAVDEAGTEAAAATAVVMRFKATPGSSVVLMKVDRPFLFLIREKGTGVILFLGRVTNPTA
ncbi:MAG: serpin family protein [Candidatus Bipolaricaulota bacterium]|nr:serpin family protein [Candidatus Bipolaricaulota bacterium]